jgi:hypothetical protein
MPDNGEDAGMVREGHASLRLGTVSAIAIAGAITMTSVSMRPQAQAPGAQTGSAAAPPAGRGSTTSPFVPPEPIDYADREGWTPLFDGKTLSGWDGNPAVWSVRDGAITAESTRERRVGSTHLIWRGEEVGDFELKLEVKLEGDIHSGIAYRSYVSTASPTAGRSNAAALQVPADPKWTLLGPGLDYDYDRKMAGNVEDRGTPRRELAWRGLIVKAEAGKRPRAIGSVGAEAELMNAVKADDWNQIHIVARGTQLTHIINGRVMTILIDEDPTYFRAKGLIGLQIEQWGLGRVNARNIYLKR